MKKITDNINTYVKKILPHSLEAEQSVLGGLMIDNNSWYDICEKIIIKDFYFHSHKLIFSAMHTLINLNRPIDIITLSEIMERRRELDKIGGFAYLAELSKNVPSTANISIYAEIIREYAVLREVITTANKMIEIGFNPQGKKTSELVDYIESIVFNIGSSRATSNSIPKLISQIIPSTISKIKSYYKKQNNGLIGIDTGYHDLNKKTFGLQRSDLIIIAARPSMGKTTFAMNICEHAAMTQDKPVLVFSLEMTIEQLIIRMISSISKVDQSKIRTGQLNSDDWFKISRTVKKLLQNNNMYIDDSSRLTPNDIRSRARKIFKECDGLSVIMIDYLQLVKIPSISDNRVLEIAEISHSLKALAKELNIPIIALSQLNRSLEQRSNKRPINSDLRESGSIEQDADLIMFIYRDEVYNESSNSKGIAEIIIGKQRNGPTGTIRLLFNSRWSRFDNYTNIEYNVNN